jgi:DNA-binding Lrp family transcriptional regulator
MADSEIGDVALDETDRRIISELVNDGRISMRSVAERAHISRAHAYVRLERLQAAGVIEGFTAQISHERAGLKASAYVALSVRQASWQSLADRLRSLPFVDHVSLLGGDYDVLVLVRAPDNAALRHLVLEELQSLDEVVATRTWLIFDEAKGPGATWV